MVNVLSKYQTPIIVRFEKEITKRMLSHTKMKKIAEETSSYSAIPIKVIYSITTANDAIASLFALSIQTNERDGFLRMTWTEELLRRAHNNNYEGKWKVVRLLSQQQNLSLYNLLQVLLENFSENDIFGNIVPSISKISRTRKIVKLYQKSRNRVNKPKRKRGYDDKGSLRPQHRWLPRHIFNGPNPEKPSIEEILLNGYKPRNSSYWLWQNERGMKQNGK